MGRATPGILVMMHAVAEREMAGRIARKFSFLFGIVSTLLIFVAVHYVGRLIPSELVPGGDYFTVTVIGIGIYSWVGSMTAAPRTALMAEMTYGTLETLAMAMPSLAAFLFAATLWHAMLALFRTALVLTVPFLMGWRCEVSQLAWIIPIFLLSGAAGYGFGLFQTGLDLRLRSAGRVVSLLGGGTAILSGVYFPNELLPPVVRLLAETLPVTHAIAAARSVLLSGIWPARELAALLILAIAACFAGTAFFDWAERSVRRDGSYLGG